MSSTAEASAATNYSAAALAWGVTRGHFTAPTVTADGTEDWDLPQLTRELRAYRKRSSGRHPRWSRAVHTRMNAQHAARQRHHEALANQRVLTTSGSTTVVHDGLGHEIGTVMLGDTLDRQNVWLIQPLSRAAHADTWDLPYARTRDAAIEILWTGSYTL